MKSKIFNEGDVVIDKRGNLFVAEGTCFNFNGRKCHEVMADERQRNIFTTAYKEEELELIGNLDA